MRDAWNMQHYHLKFWCTFCHSDFRLLPWISWQISGNMLGRRLTILKEPVEHRLSCSMLGQLWASRDVLGRFFDVSFLFFSNFFFLVWSWFLFVVCFLFFSNFFFLVWSWFLLMLIDFFVLKLVLGVRFFVFVVPSVLFRVWSLFSSIWFGCNLVKGFSSFFLFFSFFFLVWSWFWLISSFWKLFESLVFCFFVSCLFREWSSFWLIFMNCFPSKRSWSFSMFSLFFFRVSSWF